MRRRKSLITLVAATVLAVGSTGLSSGASARSAASEGSSTEGGAVDQKPAYERVDSFLIWTRPYNWQAIDDDTVVVWTTPFDAYLVELAYPSLDMRFVQQIGVTSTNSRVFAKFDAVQIRGFRYPIDRIFKLSREEAKNLTRSQKPENSAAR